jgi:RND family efflux transporter MFP subunit
MDGTRNGQRWLKGIFRAGTGASLGIAIGLLAACSKPAPPPAPTPSVTFMRPIVKEVTEWDEFTGRLDPLKSVEIRARVSGYLDSIHFKDGQTVKTGDLLFVIDPRPYAAAAEKAHAELDRAKAQQNLAKQNLDRAQKLITGRTIAAEQFDEKKNEYDIAVANVAEAAAAAKSADLELEFTQIKAPIDGRVSKRYADEGNFIDGGSAQATLLTTIVPDNPLYATFDIDESIVLKYTRLNLSGQRKSSRTTPNPVRIALADETKFTHEGAMNFVDNRLDAQTGTLRARAIINNPDGLLSPGLFVRVQLKGRGPFKALLIPDEAIGNDQSRKYVMLVVQGDIAQRRFVTPGRLYDGYREITDGLDPNDRVIVGGILRARPGAPVKPTQAELPPGVDLPAN